MNAARTVIFRADGSYEIGMGHMMRCMALSDFFAEAGWKPVFACAPDLANPTVLADRDVEFVRSAEDLEQLGHKLNAEVVVADLSHRFNAAAPDKLAAQCRELRKAAKYLAVIDGKGDECISSKVDLGADVVIAPYVGAHEQPVGNKSKMLAGTSYAIFQRAYAGLAPVQRSISPAVENILITMGGSDPFGLTEAALNAIGQPYIRTSKVTVVIGPGFSEKSKAACERAAERSGGLTRLVHAPASLAEELLATDLAIINDGLTKYEAAVTGTPAVVLSFDEHQKSLSKDFSELGCYAPFGPEKIGDSRALANLIENVSRDASLRQRMSEIGTREFDPRGGARVVQEIEKELRNGK